ncbi:MAG TPA: hypothetical protein VHL31_18200 [Geminicoccus sp.]|jgi:hypothetical protein|uniref:hypothetical protein n=1 Tax=Geminicoccus sp. TaxID=2024832 RepID=UPI002E335802|nr:hypothetical protein [Geminicoccus sp.]HEX2528221.1 hypothetical protein [Geminicoccus sp.]
MLRTKLALVAAAICAVVTMAAAAPAKAETIAISAMGFVTHCPCPTTNGYQEEEQNGTLKTIQPSSRFFAPVSFPSGVKVCRLSLVYRDFNGSDAIRARLVRKTYATGSNAFASPVIMATATSASGAIDTVRTASTTSISQATISNTNSFYYVLVESVTFNLDFLGVKIDTKPSSQSCS